MLAKIKHQFQPTDITCGQTCVAMIVGLPVESVIRGWFGGGRPTTTKHLRFILKSHGWTTKERLRRFGKSTALPDLAVLRILWPNHKRIGHWVLWADGRVYDPLSNPTDYEIYGGRISSYLEVSTTTICSNPRSAVLSNQEQ